MTPAPLGREDRAALIGARGEGLRGLMAAARAIRAEGFGTAITYSPNVFVPLTTLCRDVCHYCTFARPPRPGQRCYMTIEQVVELAERGRAAGCREALFTLGDKPELRYRQAREELAELGCATTLEYLERAAGAVLERTGLLPHLNPGVVAEADLGRLRAVSASMGIMLECSSERLGEPGMPHHGSPDKEPRRRLATIEAAGRAAIPFTSGILIGIGETRAERIDSLLELRAAHERHGHLQEVIVQNFRAKPGTLMAAAPEPPFEELLWTIAVARLVLGPEISLQAPPNLSDARFGELLDAGIDDWGGVSPVTVDHVNPEAPWPALERLEAETAARGLDLLPRLTLYPRYAREPERWCEEAVAPAVRAASDSLGYGRRWDWHAGAATPPPAGFPGRLPERRAGGAVGEALAALGEGSEPDEELLTILASARGADLGHVLDAADALRREVNGDEVNYVVTRNVNYTNVCYFRCGFCAFSKGKLADNLRGAPYLVPVEEIVRRAAEAWERGATEVCLQGGIHPGFDGDFYLGVVRAITAELPDIHVHAFSPLEVWQGASTLGLPLREYLRRLRDAGLGTLPGTAAEILDDEVRRVLCPDKINTGQWSEVMRAAHGAGLRSTSTIMFGHVDRPRNWARHLLALRRIQADTGGFTEFVPLPFVHMEAPIALRGRARHGPTLEEALLVHAVGRLALHPLITNIQASWTKLGRRGAGMALAAGANDLGGTLMNESISRAAGAEHGEELAPEGMEALIASLGRRPRQRNTLYGDAAPAQRARSFGAAPLSEPWNPSVREAGLPRRAELVRPGLAAAGVEG
ncbi:MAG TPA: 5-amino-6-(D-ribitylamino)uracil--L-tyrosine 4-hydroxyphenyl transferase CofH [Solirubrobacterales bacterium]|jgi:FO synthase|nr:5-amino-6-(D-ribitylamino)uracil--L-tyrosine 4-hydroxyphenyl transferase CofH [Solirubrobacterales bacterium]